MLLFFLEPCFLKYCCFFILADGVTLCLGLDHHFSIIKSEIIAYLCLQMNRKSKTQITIEIFHNGYKNK